MSKFDITEGIERLGGVPVLGYRTWTGVQSNATQRTFRDISSIEQPRSNDQSPLQPAANAADGNARHKSRPLSALLAVVLSPTREFAR